MTVADVWFMFGSFVSLFIFLIFNFMGVQRQLDEIKHLLESEDDHDPVD